MAMAVLVLIDNQFQTSDTAIRKECDKNTVEIHGGLAAKCPITAEFLQSSS